MRARSISPNSVRPDKGNARWTIPRTYGVWELLASRGRKRYR